MSNMKKIIFAVMALVMMVSVTLIAGTQTALAQSNEQAICEGSGGTWNAAKSVCGGAPGSRTVLGTIKDITNLLLFMIGAISVLMVIIGGIRYALSQGDQTAITGAKNTILYAIIGLVVAFAGYAIVNLVITALQ